MTVESEIAEQGRLLRSHMTAALASIDVMKTTLVTLQDSPNADEKDQAELSHVVQQLDAATRILGDLAKNLRLRGPDSDTSRDGR
jgi:hypothetical protein